jgi:hypothetical protein
METLGSRLHFSIEKKNATSMAFSKSLGYLIIWDGHYVAGMKTYVNNKNKQGILTTILSTPQKLSIMTDTGFAKKLAGNYDVLFYSKQYRHCPFKELSIINNGIKNTTTYINFNQGEAEINAEAQPIHGGIPENLFIGTNKDITCFRNTDSAMVNIRLNVNPWAFKQLYNTFKTFDLKFKMPYFDAWDGRMNFVFKGGKNVDNEYITYVYDDNFNKIEKKELKHNWVFDVQTIAGINESAADSLFKIFPPIIKGKDTLLFKDANFILTKTEKRFLIYNRHFTKPGIQQQPTQYNISINGNFGNMAQVLKDEGIELAWLDHFACSTFTFDINKKENIDLTGKLFFTDKTKNSFYYFLEMVEKSGLLKINKL